MVYMLQPCIRTRAPSFITVCLSDLDENAWHCMLTTHKPCVQVGTPIFITAPVSVGWKCMAQCALLINCVFRPGPLKLLPWQEEAFLAGCPVEKWAQRRREGKGWFHSLSAPCALSVPGIGSRNLVIIGHGLPSCPNIPDVVERAGI